MATIKSIPPQLRQGRAHIDDPLAHAKATGKYSTSPNKVAHPTVRDPKEADGYPGGPNSADGHQGWAKMDAVTARNTYTSGGSGSERD
jgi:hypothetical protein